jgi:hypothetical protein
VSAETPYRWYRRRFWLTLVLYWFTCTAGAGALARLGAAESAERAWVISLMLVLVTVCMVTERGRWKIWQRVAAVPVAWITQALLQVPAVVVVGMPIALGRPDVAERMIGLAASLPVVIFAMRQSHLFVTSADGDLPRVA